MQQHEPHVEKVTFSFAVHSEGVLGLCYFNNEAARGVNYNQTLDIYVKSEAQQFQQDAVFQQNGALPYNTCAFSSLFD